MESASNHKLVADSNIAFGSNCLEFQEQDVYIKELCKKIHIRICINKALSLQKDER